ncbi:carbon storage regulator CsrA [Halobacillus litoralis]|uniref:carbon storage regulator CsrA n=1 Tax=Halobacillus litoralis TaxID=45668 RepID=UPI001CD204A2|nr:carbon storage regulator CsrA [Halobacillus litoralis]MCA0971571.1 carbon storage regulator CsrA [Halobacillus litoralis]
MLVLNRKINESIMIGEDIEIKVISIDGGQVKLGINAPSQLEIHRKEIHLAILEENTQAASLDLDLINLLKNNSKNT